MKHTLTEILPCLPCITVGVAHAILILQMHPDAARAREASAKRIRRAQPEGADARFKRDFLDVSFGHSCGVCDRLWFSNSLVTISSIKNDQARANAIAVLQREFPASSGEYKICYSCKDSLVAGKVPPMSVSYGYTYPPKPDHLPPLNLVEERLIAPRLPFMSIRRLTHGNGQYGIKGQVVNGRIAGLPTIHSGASPTHHHSPRGYAVTFFGRRWLHDRPFQPLSRTSSELSAAET
ncbi:hypothetical protein HPB47_015734 [Ixodes persulcatus]|uniref:Uncharacterized protein n=1 Tax=Ixodes persulcatus TaxID=34615 RepID=A0AC60QSS0_IXOPE|nr:hypothetical protein HPB47_015734 [Ixodes persulcatus]